MLVFVVVVVVIVVDDNDDGDDDDDGDEDGDNVDPPLNLSLERICAKGRATFFTFTCLTRKNY